ncbi:hypothetical protein BS50DRAFT_398521 [Corynespora cassiicola Philippines]|uniref:Uncharacterized protein n=1 Tax=Corynespora cassiicola Philippines TaxID=1448308 RepID=A0A2T2NKA8_CORCC|nr:hypothetical protein BS50DRAFT_398521 [Corynespora cassiicola Philippines]
MRALRMRDENAPQALPAGKALHHRNKSTPALSTMQTGAIKAAAKRTVFADVSNTSRQPNFKDDTHVPAKDAIVLKDPAVVSTKELVKPTALMRPAQRPLANKTNGTSTTDSIASAVPKHVTADTAAASTNIRKILSKKVTTVFKETSVEPVAEPTAAPASMRIQQTERAHAKSEPLPTVNGAQRKPAEHRQQARVLEPSVAKIENESKPIDDDAEVQEKNEYLDALEEQARVIEQERNDELAKTNGLNAADHEESWDEDEDEEYYDVDGYTTTTKTLYSRGNNTTGGVTLVLAPRVTAKSQRELEAARIYVEANKSPEDVEDEQWDTSMVAEYGEEIFEYMRSLEERMKPNATYMDHQAEIQWSMRSVLMDWLVQVHNRFTLLPETLFLAVNYVDRFLSCKVVSLGKLQLVGATALFVAAKYEEINCPSVQEIVYMVDGAYTADEVLKAERFMLSMLHFELGWPGPMSFLRRISKADDYDLETRTLAKYFLEITIMDERFVGCTPSFLAAGAHCLARFMLKKGDWSQAHVHYSGYTLAQLRPLVSVIVECCENPQKHHAAVYEKYTDKRYKRAAIFVEGEVGKGFHFPSSTRESQTWRRK